MSQQILAAQILEDRRTLRQLGTVIGGFILATAVMAITIGLLFG